MKYDEYEKLIKDLASDKTDLVLDLLNKIREDCLLFDGLVASDKEKEAKINDLRETNSKLYLRCTEGIASLNKDEEPTETVEDVLKDW